MEMETRYEVMRPFSGKRPFKSGEIVDASGWKWLDYLWQNGFVRPVAVSADGATVMPLVHTTEREKRRQGRK